MKHSAPLHVHYIPALLLVHSADVQAHGLIVIWSLTDVTKQRAPCCTIFGTEWELQKTESNAYAVCVYSSSRLCFAVNIFHNLEVMPQNLGVEKLLSVCFHHLPCRTGALH